jgi:hypothetical protein
MPGLNASAVELTTAATDALLGILALSCILYLRRFRSLNRWRVCIWSLVLATLFVASMLGAVVHGLDLSPGTSALLWRPLYFLLALLVALFVVAAIYDWLGKRTAQRVLAVMISVAIGFFIVTQIVSDSFRIFVVYETISMLAALFIYVFLAARDRLKGAGLMAAAIMLNLLAAGIQASESVQLTLIWSFDHNGIFHIVQMIAVLVLMAGLRRSFLCRP